MGERDEILQDLQERARYYAGLTSIGLPPASVLDREAAVAAQPPLAPPELRSGSPAGLFTPVQSSRMSADLVAAHPSAEVRAVIPPPGTPAETLEAIREHLGDCRRCKLAGGRKTIVFGQGSPQARLMFVGEAPGADEDEQGLAFVGKAGQLLTRIIEAIGMTRDDVFIANVIKCRPPQNRNPEPDEILSCQPFLERQIDSIQPKVLVGLGKFGGQWLLKTMEPIGRIRGRLGSYKGIAVMPTWHPAYLLRNPAAKKEVWEDMKAVKRFLSS